MVAPGVANLLARLDIVAEAAGKRRLDLRLKRVGNRVAPLLAQLLHIARNLRVAAAEGIEQTLQIARYENVHRRGRRRVERAFLIIGTRADEVREHVVRVRRTDELTHRQAHLLGIPAGENIAEVAGRHDEVEFVTHGNHAAGDGIAVCREIVDNLRQQAAPVDGVGRGQEPAALRELGSKRLVAEDLLDAGLRVIKVAAHGADRDVIARLRDHLQALDLRHTAVGIEHEDLRARHVGKALQGRLAGVARGGDEDAHLPLLAALFQARREQVRQDLQRHVLERARRPVPELEKRGGVVEPVHRRNGRVVKLAAVGRGSEARKLGVRKLAQKRAHDRHGALLIRHAAQRLKLLRGHLRQRLRHEQAAVRREAAGDRLRGGNNMLMISCAVVVHIWSLIIQKHFRSD